MPPSLSRGMVTFPLEPKVRTHQRKAGGMDKRHSQLPRKKLSGFQAGRELLRIGTPTSYLLNS